MGCVRYIYNKGLETKIKYYETNGKTLNYFDMAGPTGLLIKEKREYTWLNIPNAQSLQMSLRNLDNAFTNFFKKKSKFPVFKKKSGHESIQYPQYVFVDFKNNITKIPKAGKVFTVFDRKFDGKIKTCTVSKTPTNKFFISILVDDSKELPMKAQINSLTAVGIDLGIKDFAILSNGEKVANPKYLKKVLNRIKVLQKRASKKTKGSNNKKKANLKIARAYEKVSNQRTDFLQKTSTKIIRENQTIILEDLNVSGMMKNHKLSQAISDVSWSEFIRMLTYKAEWNGKNIIHIGRFEPSSKLCNECGWKNKELTLADREWSCKECGVVHDRDLNAAINIKKFGLIKAKSGQELSEELVEMPRCKGDQRNKKSKTAR
jgi:putative transposase